MAIRTLLAVTTLLSLTVACQNDRALDSEAATTAFVECLERNGVEAQGVRVTLDGDGSVAGIEAVIISEGDAAYEPTVRLACTGEVESR